MKNLIRKKIDKENETAESSTKNEKSFERIVLTNILETDELNEIVTFRNDMKSDPYYKEWLKEEKKKMNRDTFLKKSSILASNISEYEALLIEDYKRHKVKAFFNKLEIAERMYNLTSVDYCDTIYGKYLIPLNKSRYLELKKITDNEKNQNVDDGLLESFYKYAISHATNKKIIAGMDLSEKLFYEYRLGLIQTQAYATLKEKDTEVTV